MKCYKCGSENEELRPYGPSGSDVCFDCMSATPETENAARQQFLATSTAAARRTGFALLTRRGPVPMIGGNRLGKR